MPELPAPGFDRPTTTPVPDELFDLWLPHLSEAELKVLLYIIRRTLGFKKDADAISLSQLATGIVRRDGRRLDSGAGVSEKSCRRGIAGLLEKGLITQTKTKLPDGGDGTTVYGLVWRGGTSDHRGLDNLSEARWSDGTPQETDVTTHRENGSDELHRAALKADLRARCKRYGVTLYGEQFMLDAWLASADRTSFSEQLNRVLPTANSLTQAAFDMGIREQRQ